MRVLQIGAGPTGVSVFRQVYEVLKKQNEILDYVIADDKEPGKGLAFGTGFNTHILNLPASIMSLDPANPLEFCEWRSTHESFWNDGTYKESAWSEFPPRRLFGKYVSSIMQNLLIVRPDAHLIKKKVVSIYELKGPNKFLAKYEDGETELFDKVILCLGHSPLKPLFETNHSIYKHSPYDVKNIPQSARIGIIGSRLTAIDIVLALKERGHTGEIYMASRSGVLPKIFHEKKKPYDSSEFIEKLLKLENSSLNEIIEIHKKEIKRVTNVSNESLNDLLFNVDSKETLDKELKLLGITSEWQSVLLASYTIVDQLWIKLSQSDRDIFLKNYYGIWMTFLAAYPKSSALAIKEMMDMNQLHLIGGVESFTLAENNGYINLKDSEKINVDYLIDGRGVGYSKEDFNYSTLLKSLIDNGLIEIHMNGGLKIDVDTYESLTLHGPVNNLHIIGDLTKGEFLSTTDVGRCVNHSFKFAKSLKDADPQEIKVA